MKQLFAATLLALTLVGTAIADVVVSNQYIEITTDAQYIDPVDNAIVVGSGDSVPVTIQAFAPDPIGVRVMNPNGAVLYVSDIMNPGEILTFVLSQADVYGTWTVRVTQAFTNTVLDIVPFTVKAVATPTTPEEAVTESTVILDEAIADGTITVQANFLQAMLDNALRQLDKGNVRVAEKMLVAFIAEVESQLADGTVDAATASTLISLANAALGLI